MGSASKLPYLAKRLFFVCSEIVLFFFFFQKQKTTGAQRFERKRGTVEERRQVVVRAMATGWGDAELDAAHSSRESQRLRAEAVAGYVMLLVFEFSTGAA